MFGQSTYNIVGGLIGYILCPIALLGLAAPLAVFLPAAASPIIGHSLLTVGGAIVVCNLYLSCRRFVVQGSASYFPMFGAFAAAGGVAALLGPFWWIPAILIFGVIDLFGQPLLASFVVAVLRLDKSDRR